MSDEAQHRRPLNGLKSLWRDGRTALGVIVTMPSVQVVQVLARTGLDYILIDMEHGAIAAGAAHAMIAATSGTPLAGPSGFSPIAITIGDADTQNMLGGPRSDRSRKH